PRPSPTLFPYTTRFRSPCRPQLVERQRPVENVAAGQAELAFEVERREYFAGDHRRLEVGRIAGHGVDDMVGGLLADVVPGQIVRDRKSTRLNSSHVKIS